MSAQLSEKKRKRFRLHNHPKMEQELSIPEGHVIIDKDVFIELLSIHGTYIFPDEIPDAMRKGVRPW